MKNLFFIFLAVMSVHISRSQAPALIPYQAVARDAAGQPIANTSLTARFTLHNLTATGASVWQEVQTISTSALGLFTAHLGSVSPLMSVNWGSGAKFMQVEINAGNGFVDIGTQQLLSVPYALHSSEAENAQTAQNGISGVSAVGDTLYLANGTFLTVPGISISNSGGVSGCTDNTACNYNPAATENDGICYYVGGACNDNNPATLNDAFNANCVCAGGAGVSGAAHSCGLQYVHDPNLTYGTMTDQEGNAYKTIVIGTQVWMAENLKTSTYRNGDAILTNLSNAEWENTFNTQQGAWAYCNNNASNACPYGKLYNWYAVNDARNLCPFGWHVPSDAEWIVLTSYLSGSADYGGHLKTTGTNNMGTGLWNSPNTGATNSSGFSGLPGSYRNPEGNYYLIGYEGFWWSSSQNGTNDSWSRQLFFEGTIAYRGNYDHRYGFSVRCLRD